MTKSWAGPLVAGVIVLGVAGILIANLQDGGARPPSVTAGQPAAKQADSTTPPALGPGGSFEHPIGDPVEKNHLAVAAVWLSAVQMDGMASAGSGPELIHVEADVKATENNPNGFAKDEFVPYLKVGYRVVPAAGGEPVAKGDLVPMVAADGLHYGANIEMPQPGDYKMVYDIQPPSSGGLGRHSDKATGVAPWWAPFEAAFEWTVEPPTKSPALAAGR